MTARIVVVHDEQSWRSTVADALRGAGLDVAAFADPLAAMAALEDAKCMELLLTRIHFPSGRSNGVALARMARVKRPETKIVFLEQADDPTWTEGLGQSLEVAVDASAIIPMVERLLQTHE